MLKKLLWGLLVLVLIVGGYALWVLNRMGAFTTVEAEFAGTCKQITGIKGPEDLTIDPDTGIAYISSNNWADFGSEPGAIYGYDLKDAEAKPINLTPLAQPGFHPHGISLWRGEAGGPRRLMVVTHPVRNGDLQHEVVIFEALGMAFREVNTVKDPSPEAPEFLTSPNDIVAISPNEFYFTNDHESDDPDEQFSENLWRKGLSNVVHYRNGTFAQVTTGHNYANGIEASADGSKVYVAASQDKSVTVFDRDPGTGALTEVKEIDIDGWADNLNWAPDGRLLVGTHPNAYRLTQRFSDGETLSPGTVIAVDPEAGTTEQIYATDGTELSTLSVAAQYGNRLLIGAISVDYFLDCTMGE